MYFVILDLSWYFTHNLVQCIHAFASWGFSVQWKGGIPISLKAHKDYFPRCSGHLGLLESLTQNSHPYLCQECSQRKFVVEYISWQWYKVMSPWKVEIYCCSKFKSADWAKSDSVHRSWNLPTFSPPKLYSSIPPVVIPSQCKLFSQPFMDCSTYILRAVVRLEQRRKQPFFFFFTIAECWLKLNEGKFSQEEHAPPHYCQR